MFDFNFSESIVNFSNFEFSQLGDAFLFGGLVLLIGIGAVFSVLCILWLFIVVFKIAINDIPQRIKRNKKPTVTVAPVIENTVDARTTGDDEIIAVISAAIAAAESDNTGMKFRVVSFKRI